jgi:hypothetical protein
MRSGKLQAWTLAGVTAHQEGVPFKVLWVNTGIAFADKRAAHCPSLWEVSHPVVGGLGCKLFFLVVN